MSISSLVGTHDMKYYIYQIQQYPLISALLKFGVAFPLTYHYLGGLRHLVRDLLLADCRRARASAHARLRTGRSPCIVKCVL